MNQVRRGAAVLPPEEQQIAEFLNSLTKQERVFIAGLDYGVDLEKHQAALDVILENGGIVDFDKQGYWHPYEVIELGKNWLQAGHEREYTACMVIVLKNIRTGADRGNDLEMIVDSQYDSIKSLPGELRNMVDRILEELAEKHP